MSIFSKIGNVFKKAAPKILGVVGGAVGTVIAPGVGTKVGGSLGSAIGGVIQNSGKKPPTGIVSPVVVSTVPAAPVGSSNPLGLGVPRSVKTGEIIPRQMGGSDIPPSATVKPALFDNVNNTGLNPIWLLVALVGLLYFGRFKLR